MKKLIYGTLFLALVGIGFASCEKEELVNSAKTEINDKSILRFDNFEELNKELHIVTELNEDERRAYEKSKGFTSLMTSAYQNYEKLDIENSKSVEDIQNFVSENNSILALEPNSDRELVFFSYYVDNIYTFLANTDRMLVVGEDYLKVFEDGIAFTTKENFEKLMAITEKYLSEVPQNDWLIASVFTTDEIQDRTSCGNSYTKTGTDTNGKNRTKITVYTGNPYGGGSYSPAVFGQIRPYKKTLGIWYYAKRTMSGRAKATANLNVTPSGGSTTVETISLNKSVSGYKAYSWWTFKDGSGTYDWPTSVTQPQLKTVDSYGDTPDTAPATIICS